MRPAGRDWGVNLHHRRCRTASQMRLDGARPMRDAGKFLQQTGRPGFTAREEVDHEFDGGDQAIKQNQFGIVEQLLVFLERVQHLLDLGAGLGHGLQAHGARAALQGVRRAHHVLRRLATNPTRAAFLNLTEHVIEMPACFITENLQQRGVKFRQIFDRRCATHRRFRNSRRRCGCGNRGGNGIHIRDRLAISERIRHSAQSGNLVVRRDATLKRQHHLWQQRMRPVQQIKHGFPGFDLSLAHPVQHVFHRPGKLRNRGGANHAAAAFERVKGAAQIKQGVAIGRVGVPGGQRLVDERDHLARILNKNLDDVVVAFHLGGHRTDRGRGDHRLGLVLRRRARRTPRQRLRTQLATRAACQGFVRLTQCCHHLVRHIAAFDHIEQADHLCAKLADAFLLLLQGKPDEVAQILLHGIERTTIGLIGEPDTQIRFDAGQQCLRVAAVRAFSGERRGHVVMRCDQQGFEMRPVVFQTFDIRADGANRHGERIQDVTVRGDLPVMQILHLPVRFNDQFGGAFLSENLQCALDLVQGMRHGVEQLRLPRRGSEGLERFFDLAKVSADLATNCRHQLFELGIRERGI